MRRRSAGLPGDLVALFDEEKFREKFNQAPQPAPFGQHGRRGKPCIRVHIIIRASVSELFFVLKGRLITVGVTIKVKFSSKVTSSQSIQTAEGPFCRNLSASSVIYRFS